MILRKIEEVSAMNIPIDMIAPSHGLIWRKDPMRIVNTYASWAKNETRKKVVIFYESMWGSTEKMAKKMAEGIEGAGVSVKLFDVSSADRTELIKEMFDAKIPAKCMADYGAYDLGFITAAGLDAAKACPIVGVPDPNDFPGSEPLVAAFTAKFPTEPGVWSPYTYDSVKLLAARATEAGSFDAEPLSTALAATKDWKGWTGTVASFESPSGNRQPAPVTINLSDAGGNFRVDQSWVTATGFVF